jgi:GDP-D-mannose dehydratase
VDFVFADGVGIDPPERLKKDINEALTELPFDELGMNYEKYFEHDTIYDRITTNTLLANPQKTKETICWEAKTEFEDLIRMMVSSDVNLLNK